MADRLASYNDLVAYMQGASDIASGSAQYNALQYILDGVARRMATYLLRSPYYRLAQTTSDGINSQLEYFGTEHYGRHDRTIIRLHRFPLVSITSIFDNQNAVDSSYYQLDYEEATIFRVVGKWYKAPKAVQVVYTAGFAPNGQSGDAAALVVPEDLRNEFLRQCKYEYSRWQPGSLPPEGATTISRPDGSIIVPAQPWLASVKEVMDGYRRSV